MTTACTGVFALVGGGMVQDQLQFSGKDGSDFHEYALIDIPGFADSPEKSDSNGQIQPIPNPGTSQNVTWFRDFQQLEPDASSKWVTVSGELPLHRGSRAKVRRRPCRRGRHRDHGVDLLPGCRRRRLGALRTEVDRFGGDQLGSIGEPVFFAKFLETARQRGWEGTALVETNMYSEVVSGAGPATEGTVVRSTFHPLEEADQWPATADYIDIVESNVDDPLLGSLGMQSFSAWLLFATAANACGEQNDGVLDRTCILEQAAAVEDWTGGGLHGSQDPATVDEVVGSPCGMLLVVHDGEFERLYPEVGGDGDDGDGFHCPDDGVSEVTGTNSGKVDPDRPI